MQLLYDASQGVPLQLLIGGKPPLNKKGHTMTKHTALPRSLLIPSIIIYPVLICVLILTAVVPDIDLELSLRAADVNNAFGNFLEIWAEPPTLLLASFCLAMAACLCARAKTTKGRVIAAGADIAGIVVAYQTVYRTTKYYNEEFAGHWYIMLACAALGALLFVLFRLVVRRISPETLSKTGRVLFFAIVSLLLTLIIISTLKSIWGRTRFRAYLLDNANGFTAWFLPQGKPASDLFKSFPSGHTSNALVLLPMTYIWDSVGKKTAGRICRGLLCLWVPTVMLSRVLCGAHYLSDICAGAFVTYTIILVTALLLFRKKKVLEF